MTLEHFLNIPIWFIVAIVVMVVITFWPDGSVKTRLRWPARLTGPSGSPFWERLQRHARVMRQAHLGTMSDAWQKDQRRVG